MTILSEEVWGVVCSASTLRMSLILDSSLSHSRRLVQPPMSRGDATRLRGVPRLVFSFNELKRVG